MRPRSLQRHRALFRRSWPRLVLGIALAAVQTLSLLPLPVLIRRAIDVAIPEGRRGEIAALAAAMVGLTVLSAAVTLLARRVTLRVTKRAASDLRRDVIDRLNRAPRQFHVTADQGRLHETVVRETDRIDLGTSSLIADLLPSAVLVLGMLGVLISIDWVLTTVTVVTGALFAITNKSLLRQLDRRFARYHRALEAFSRGVTQMLRVQDLMRIHGARQVETANRDRELAALEQTAVSRALALTAYEVIQQSLIAFVGAMILFVGGLRAAAGATSIGDLISFYAGFALLRGPLSSGSGAIPTIIEGRQALDRLYAKLDEIDPDPYIGQSTIELIGALALEHVSLRYDGALVLDDVSLRVEPGCTLALVGANGSGKSSAVNVLLGLYRPEHGRVLADGVSYEHLDIASLMQQFGVVPQVPFFFPGTVRENLLYGSRDTDEAALQRALELANAWEFVQQLPGGLDAELSDDALTLSGGQRQRLAIARALVREPAVLVLDEPTNHLDRATVAALLDALRTLDPSPTVIVVSHDEGFLEHVDEIVRMEHGRVVQRSRTGISRSATAS
jgi:ABC-type multidrug transport system fused ATPase/permease subunit